MGTCRKGWTLGLLGLACGSGGRVLGKPWEWGRHPGGSKTDRVQHRHTLGHRHIVGTRCTQRKQASHTQHGVRTRITGTHRHEVRHAENRAATQASFLAQFIWGLMRSAGPGAGARRCRNLPRLALQCSATLILHNVIIEMCAGALMVCHVWTPAYRRGCSSSLFPLLGQCMHPQVP